MNNPFGISDEKLTDMIVSYDAWIKSDPKEENYPKKFRDLSRKIIDDFLTKDALSQMSDDELYDKVFKYSRQLEGPVQIKLGEPRIRGALDEIRRNLMYIMTTSDSPFVVAQNILAGKYKIEVFAKAFWSPILLAQFPDILPNWNNKTENFLKKFGINISSSKLSIAEKYKILSEAFTLLSGLKEGNDFYNINHLMHYGTIIPEGIKIVDELTGKEVIDPVKTMIIKYKDKIRKTRLKDEIYKWELLKKYQGRPDLNIDDFSSEIKSIDYSNLIYPMVKAVRNHLADTVSKEYRACLVKLFNEEEDLKVRIKEFDSDMNIAYQKSEGRHGHQHDERTIATFLTYHTPNKYTFFKNSYYQDYCKMTGVEPKAKGDKYFHYLELVADLRERYILPDPELINLVNGFLNPDCFADENHLVLVQDILYQMLSKEGDEPIVVEEEKVEIPNLEKNMPNIQLNTILYGSPGTGKTFHSISHAVAIVENTPVDLIAKEDRVLVKSRFDHYVLDGQIVFCTFHQSMGYEDFIEGIKPMPPIPNESLNYDIESGIFKRACANAAYLCYKKWSKTKGVPKVYSFDDLYRAFLDSIIPLVNAKKYPIYKSINGRDYVIYEIKSNYSIGARSKESTDPKAGPLTKTNMEKLYNRYSEFGEIKDVKEFRAFKINIREHEFCAVFGGLKDFEKIYASDNMLFANDNGIDSIEEDQKQEKFDAGVYYDAIKEFGKIAEPVVLIIDEINRGNVSQIFGELITLIEEDKRLGMEESLEVILPYSKMKFGVPPNLYIIGTMNTADRSVEALDTALRRRFSFIHMEPKEDILTKDLDGENINLQLLLQSLNKRLRILKDEDHTIGHAWFMGVKNIKQLREVFGNKILPLLQEYFYNDYEKLGLLLGDAFFKPHIQVNSTIFAPFSGGNGLAGQYDQAWQYQLKPTNELTVEDFKSLEFLNNQAVAGEE